MGRPRIHATNAERQRAYRATKKAAILTPRQAEVIDEIAEQFETTRAVVLHNLVRFALTNRNWKQVGLLTFQVPTDAFQQIRENTEEDPV